MAGTPMANYTQQDFQLIPFLNAVAEPVSGSVTPSAANVGRFYRNTSTNRIEYVLSSSTVVSIPYSGSIGDADIASGAGIAIAKLAVNPLARANHTGTQTASTVSDFDTQVNTHKPTDLALMTSAFNFNGQQAKSMADPTAATDGVTLQYLQYLQSALSSAINGHDWKDNVRVATGGKSSQGNVTVSNPGTATIDGVSLTAGDRILLAAQTTASENGIYQFNGSGAALTRTTDANSASAVTEGMSVPITEGTNINSIAMLTTVGAITLGTTSLSFMFLVSGTTYTQGTGISITGNSIALTVPVTVANGGTGGTTAATARASLVVPQRGYTASLGALTAGTGLAVTHALGTLGVIVQVYRISDGATVNIGTARTDTNTVTVTSDVAVTANTLQVVVEPII